MKKILLVLLLAPCFCQAQSEQAIQKQIDASISKIVFPVVKMDAKYFNVKPVTKDSSFVTMQPTADVTALASLVAILQGKVDAMEKKIAAGLIVTGTAK